MKKIGINRAIANQYGLTQQEAVVLDYLVQRSEFCSWFSFFYMEMDLAFLSENQEYFKRKVRSLRAKGVISYTKRHAFEYPFSLTFVGRW